MYCDDEFELRKHLDHKIRLFCNDGFGGDNSIGVRCMTCDKIIVGQDHSEEHRIQQRIIAEQVEKLSSLAEQCDGDVVVGSYYDGNLLVCIKYTSNHGDANTWENHPPTMDTVKKLRRRLIKRLALEIDFVNELRS